MGDKEETSILNKLFETKNSYKEAAPEIDKNEFIKTVRSRRSVRIFNEEPVLEKDMLDCLELTLLAPNSSNLQPWEFYWVRDKEKKKELVQYCLNQPAAKTARELVVCVSRYDFWKPNAKRMLKLFNEKEKSVPKSSKAPHFGEQFFHGSNRTSLSNQAVFLTSTDGSTANYFI